MPTYEFRCVKCNEVFEHRMSLSEREQGKPACPTCKSREVETVLSAFMAKTSRKS